MATTVTIKSVDQQTWKVFKIDAIRHGQTTAEHFSQIVKQHCTVGVDNPLQIMARLRAKAGRWSGSAEVTKWRKKRVF